MIIFARQTNPLGGNLSNQRWRQPIAVTSFSEVYLGFDLTKKQP
ncbi:MAG: hypothetical protein RBR03_08675 [Desulfuromonas thiophila]|jgi:hypothetical protein|nr:hypothetical protein [Desulfuromonas thiophila]